MVALPKTSIYEGHPRGRPNSRFNLYGAHLKSIILISRKYKIDPKLLIGALADAWNNKTSDNGLKLKVSCRNIDQDPVTFLITNGDVVVSQFPIKMDSLKAPEFFQRLAENVPEREYEQAKVVQKQKKVGELRFGMDGVDVKAKVVDVPPKKLVVTSFGNQVYVSNIKISDETGVIKLSLWNDKIDLVHVGDEVEITNCHVASFGGELQLRIKRKGAISIKQ